MSKIFYDHLISFTEIELHVKKTAGSSEEREELWNIVDEIIHHRMVGVILDNLPKEYHGEFLTIFHAAPHDEKIIMFLSEHIEGNVEELIQSEADTLREEILTDLKLK